MPTRQSHRRACRDLIIAAGGEVRLHCSTSARVTQIKSWRANDETYVAGYDEGV